METEVKKSLERAFGHYEAVAIILAHMLAKNISPLEASALEAECKDLQACLAEDLAGGGIDAEAIHIEARKARQRIFRCVELVRPAPPATTANQAK